MLKDEDELNAYFMDMSLQDAKLFVNPEAPPIQGQALESLVVAYQTLIQTLIGSRRKYPEELTRALVKVDKLTPELMSNEEAVQQWSASLVEELRLNPDANPSVAVKLDPETNVYVPEVSLLLKGVSDKVALTL